MRQPAVRSSVTKYGLSLAALLVAVAVRWLLDPLLHDDLALVTIFGAIALSVWLGGYRPALLVTVLGYAICGYLFIEPRGSIDLRVGGNLVGLVAYLGTCSLIIWFGEAMCVAQRRADEQGETLETTVASIGDAVITTNASGIVTYLNPVAEQISGWTRTEARGKPLAAVFNIINELSGTSVENPVDRVLKTGQIVGLANHTMLICKDGTKRPIDDSAAPIRDENGQTIGVVLVFRDITERRRAELALRRSERELSDFFDNASIGLHWVGPDGIILRANQAELDLLGFKREEYVGRHIAEIHVDRAVIEDMLARLAQGETIRDHPAQMRAKDGSIRDVLINSNALFEDGQFIHSRCFTRDVTRLRRVHETQAHLAAIVEASDDAIVSKSLNGVIQSWNAGAERIFGYPAEQAIGQHISLIIPPDRADEEVEIMNRLRAGERIDHFESVRRRSDGRLIDVSLTISPIQDESGRVIGASKTARDITNRKLTEDALRESEERFRTMADNISQFAWMADEKGLVFWYNRRWYEYTGTTLDQMQGWGWKKVHHPDHVDRVVERVQRSWDTGEVWEDTFPLRGKDGQYRWFLSRALPIRGADGKVVRWFGTNTDITEQLAAEQALLEADRRKDEFLASLAHELRNPLAPIRHGLEILKRDTRDGKSVEPVLSTMDRQLCHMVRLVDDLLDVSRITRDKLELRKERVELVSIISQAIEAVRPLGDSLGHEITVHVPDEPIYVDGDPARLIQVFGNLINNACNYTDPSGRITVTAKVTGGEVDISVKDDGVGIPAEMLPRVFDMFSQVDHSLERSHGGLGIGLTLVKRLVEMHNGSVSAHSEGVGKGSVFVVGLPVAAEPKQADSKTATTADSSAHSLRILVVDDNIDSAKTLSMLLSLMGHETFLAHDGEQAVEAAKQFLPQVVLLDIGLPKLNGYDVCRAIRQQPWGAGMMIVAVTGWGQDEDRRKSDEAGFNEHLVKPVSHEALQRLLSDAPTPA